MSEARLPALVGGFAMTASVSGESGMEGTLCALGDRFGGFSFHLLEGRPVADFVVFGNATRVESGAPVAAGDHRITLRYNGPRSGMVELVVDDIEIKAGEAGPDAIKSIGLVRLRLDRDPLETHRYWEQVHGPLAVPIPQLRRYVQSHVRPGAYRGGARPAWDGP